MEKEQEILNLPAAIENASPSDVLIINKSISEIRNLLNVFLDSYVNINNLDAFSTTDDAQETFSRIGQKCMLLEYYFQRISNDLKPF
jgi:hypothetical protein